MNKCNETLIYAYTRRQAIKDGVLVDVTALAAWTKYVQVPEACPWQDHEGRLWDVLWMLHVAIKRTPESNPIYFSVMVQNEPGPAKEVKLKAVCGPDDSGQPCVTIMLPNED